MRLDQYLVKEGLVSSRSKASDLIRRQLVTVNGVIARKTGQKITDEKVHIISHMQYVGRGGEKLAGAIKYFNVDFKDKIVIDVGSSTGGFTDVALKQGASHVYAYDVGSHQLDDVLRHDPRVSVYENTNFLDVDLPKADIIVIDVSFISITTILKHIKGFKGTVIGLVKPQFEVGPTKMKHGVLKDKKIHQKILYQVILFAHNIHLPVVGIMTSTLKGKKGNQEYMIIIDSTYPPLSDIEESIEDVTC